MSHSGCEEFDTKPGQTPRLIEDFVFPDSRGYFGEIWQEHGNTWNTHKPNFITSVAQVNHSFSTQGTVRGMHWQVPPHDVGKFVTCISGVIQDVVVDIRQSSSTFKCWQSYYLPSPSAASNERQLLWVPSGFAHGFLTVSEEAHVIYLQDGRYCKEAERSFCFNDAEVAIDWLEAWPNRYKLSEKDANASKLSALPPRDLFA